MPPEFVLVYHQHVDLFRLSGFFHETGFQREASTRCYAKQ